MLYEPGVLAGSVRPAAVFGRRVEPVEPPSLRELFAGRRRGEIVRA